MQRMYICVCKAVTESRLRRTVEAGEAVSLRDLTRELGVGTGCGKCVPAAREVLADALLLRSAVIPALAQPRAALSCGQ